MNTYFSPEQLTAIVNKVLPQDATPGQKVVVGTVDMTGAQVIAGFKRKASDDGFVWEFQAAARHNWGGDNTVGAKVLLKW